MVLPSASDIVPEGSEKLLLGIPQRQATENEKNEVHRQLILNFLVKKNKTMILLFLVVLLSMPVEAVILPQFYSKLFACISSGDQQGGLVALLLIFILWIGVITFIGIKTTIEANIEPEYMSFIRNKAFASLIERHKNDYEDIRVGEYLSRILDVSRSMVEALIWALSQALPVCLVVIAIIIFFFTVDVRCGGVMLAGTLVSSVAIFFMARRCVRLTSKRESYYIMMSEKMHDSFGNLMNVYLNNSEKDEVKSNNSILDKHTHLYNKQQEAGRNTVVMLCCLTVATFAATVFFMLQKWQSGKLSARQFTSAWIVLLYFLSTQLRVCNELPSFFMQLGIYDRSVDFFANLFRTEDAEKANKQSDVIVHGNVRFQNVTFAYPGSKHPILKNFNLEVSSGEKVALLGMSGSGKTTAMKLLVGMYPPPAVGTIEVDRIRVENIDNRHLRAKVNYVNQRTQLFNKSILENIKYGNPRLKEKKIIETLQTYQLDAVFDKLKNGIHTSAGVHGGNLSLGMQKVTMLLRGLYKPAKIVILDEPLAGLDAKTRDKIMSFIMDMCADKTLLIITHDQEVIPHMDRVVNLSKPKTASSPTIPDKRG